MDAELVAKWTAAGQGHVFKWVDSLSKEELVAFEKQLKKFDIAAAVNVFRKSTKECGSAVPDASSITPFAGTTVLANASDEERAAWRTRGLRAIAGGHVACLLLAGGQGTRLGFHHPKGMFDLGLPSGSSLFQLHAEKILRAQCLAQADGDGSAPPPPPLPWYIMTSESTHSETVAFFEEHGHFGLRADQVVFFQQGTLPCFTFEGQVIMSSAGRVAEAPDGNGSVYLSVLRSGALDDMERRGVQVVCQFGVDNCLAVPADPEFIGFQLERGADCCPKTVPKQAPDERVGSMACVDGRPAVVEYSEISEAMANERDADGRLVYRSCHVCINSYTVPFLRRIVADGGILDALPYHVAKKAIPAADPVSGQPASAPPAQPNGIKLEAFIFDVFPYAERLLAFEVARDDQFAPLKNASGSANGSNPETCRQQLSAWCRRHIEAAGGVIEQSDALCEISPLLSLLGENLEQTCKGVTFSGSKVLVK